MPVIAWQLSLGWLGEEPGAVEACRVVLKGACREGVQGSICNIMVC